MKTNARLSAYHILEMFSSLETQILLDWPNLSTNIANRLKCPYFNTQPRNSGGKLCIEQKSSPNVWPPGKFMDLKKKKKVRNFVSNGQCWIV